MLPGCVESVDCMSIAWKNCPKSFKGQYHNQRLGKVADVSVEAMCNMNLYSWHVHVGRPRTNKVIKVAETSPLFIDILTDARGMKLPNGFEINGEQKDWHCYFLVDGIYAEWAIFLKLNRVAMTVKDTLITQI